MADNLESSAIPADLEDYTPEWIRPFVASLGPAERAEFFQVQRAAIAQIVHEVSRLPVNAEPDDASRMRYSARVPGTNTFINVKTTIWNAVRYAGPFALVAAYPPLAAVVGTKLTFATASGGAAAVYSAIARLNPVQMNVYAATAAAISRNKGKTLANDGADYDEIVKSFDLDADLERPHDVEAVLKDLVTKKVLTAKADAGIEQFYLAF